MKIANFVIIILISICTIGCRVRIGKSSPVYQKAIFEISDSMKQNNHFDPDTICNKEGIFEKYKVNYSVQTNNIIADTIYVSDTVYKVFYNHSLFLTVYYNERLILNEYEIKSSSFSGIENPEKFQLSPMGAVEINSSNDTLFVSTGMFVIDTDWGYFLTIKISKNGDVLLYADDADNYYTE